jgi:hypothetical protein
MVLFTIQPCLYTIWQDIADCSALLFNISVMLVKDATRNLSQYHFNNNIGVCACVCVRECVLCVCVCVCELLKYEAVSFAVLQELVIWLSPTWLLSHQIVNSLFQIPCILYI